MRLWIMTAAAFVLTAPLAFAQNGTSITVASQNSDTVSLSLSAEDWVQTQSARTELAVDATLPGSDAGKVRTNILNAIKSMAQGADWRFTSFDRNQDASGLERWHAIVEARLPEAQLDGLSDRAKQASKPGVQIKVQAIDFTPTLAEVEATKAKLRGDIYKKINDALAQLNQAETDRKYRILRIDFNEPGNQPPRPRMMKAMGMSSGEADSSGDVSVSEKAELRANVTFAAPAPKE